MPLAPRKGIAAHRATPHPSRSEWEAQRRKVGMAVAKAAVVRAEVMVVAATAEEEVATEVVMAEVGSVVAEMEAVVMERPRGPRC